MKKTLISLATLLVISTSATAADNDLSLKIGTIENSGVNINAYGVEWIGFKHHGKHFISGLGIGAMSLSGTNENGWGVEADIRIGVEYWDIKFYGLGGGYTHEIPGQNQLINTQGYHYGGGIGILGFKHLSTRIEYKVYNDRDAVANGMSGAYISFGYRF